MSRDKQKQKHAVQLREDKSVTLVGRKACQTLSVACTPFDLPVSYALRASPITSFIQKLLPASHT